MFIRLGLECQQISLRSPNLNQNKETGPATLHRSGPSKHYLSSISSTNL